MNLSSKDKTEVTLQYEVTSLEINLLLSCSQTRLDNSVKQKINFLLKQQIDWEYLVSLATRHGVLPLLFNSLKATSSEIVPTPIFEKLKIYFQSNAKRSLFLTSELLRTITILQKNGINAVSFKGPMLAASVYGNLAYRQFSDLDIIVPPKDFYIAKELLLSHQYKSYLTKLEEIFIFNHAFQIPLSHTNGMFSLDLHWGIAPRKPRQNSSFSCLWSNLSSVSLGGQLVPNFSPESTLLIQCINATKEPYQQLLKQICDINETIQVYPDLCWDIVLHQAQKLGCRHLVLIGLCLTQKLYGTILPDEIVDQILAIPVVEIFAEESKQRFLKDASQLKENFTKTYFVNKYNFLTTEPRDRLWFLFDKIITPHAEDRNFITLPSSFYYLYYLIRPIRLIGGYKIFWR